MYNVESDLSYVFLCTYTAYVFEVSGRLCFLFGTHAMDNKVSLRSLANPTCGPVHIYNMFNAFDLAI